MRTQYFFQYSILKSPKIKFIAILIFLPFAPMTFSQNRIQIIDSLLTVYHTEGKLNGNVLIAEKGQIIYNRSFGFANLITKKKLNENSVFGLASVSKQFTAMAIVILKDQGKLNFDDKITKYLPELTAYNNISIRNLLNHTSGLIPDLEKDTKEAKEYMSTKLVGNTVTNKDMVAFLSIYKPKLRFSPNTKSEYCNTGYELLASIIEKVSGVTYAEYLNKVIFKPLELINTFVYSPGFVPDKNHAYDYIYSDSLKKYLSADSIINKNNVKVALDGGGSIYSTVIDLLKWDRALYTNKLVSNSSLKEMFEPATLSDKTKTSYGFGWFIQQDPNYGKLVFHTGSDRGYSTCIVRQLDNNKTIIILENYSPGLFPIDAINRNLYSIPLPKEIKLSQEQNQELEGIYGFQKGPDLRVWSENGKLFAQVTGQNVVPLFAENELPLFPKIYDLKLQFEKNNQGKITRLFILKGGNKTMLEKRK
jgi:CubicO group peptidase (beta-lactamase class C family)